MCIYIFLILCNKFVATWMNLECVMKNEKNEKEKDIVWSCQHMDYKERKKVARHYLIDT